MKDPPVLYSIDLEGCAGLGGFGPSSLEAAFAQALTAAGATIVGRAMHVFPGQGLTCVLILRESHAVLHTWPETGTVNLDIFSCSARLRSLAAAGALGQLLGATHISVQETARVDGHLRAAARDRT